MVADIAEIIMKSHCGKDPLFDPSYISDLDLSAVESPVIQFGFI